jgi:hypothetical protein
MWLFLGIINVLFTQYPLMAEEKPGIYVVVEYEGSVLDLNELNQRRIEFLNGETPVCITHIVSQEDKIEELGGPNDKAKADMEMVNIHVDLVKRVKNTIPNDLIYIEIVTNQHKATFVITRRKNVIEKHFMNSSETKQYLYGK